MDNMEIYNKCKSVPDTAKKTITGGRLNGMTDINPMWRIKALTEMFGPCGIGWYYNTVKQWVETAGDEAAAFVNIELFIRTSDGEWSKPISGTGGSMFVAKQKQGAYVSDECYKMATTDALSVACKQLGIGADVYWDKDKTKYSAREDSPEKKPINDARLKPVYEELKRTGYGEKAVCAKYKINSIQDMSDLQISNFLDGMKKVPDKEENK